MLSENQKKHIEKSINCTHAVLPSDYLYAIMCAGRKYYDYRDEEGNLLPGTIEEFEATIENIYSKMH